MRIAAPQRTPCHQGASDKAAKCRGDGAGGRGARQEGREHADTGAMTMAAKTKSPAGDPNRWCSGCRNQRRCEGQRELDHGRDIDRSVAQSSNGVGSRSVFGGPEADFGGY